MPQARTLHCPHILLPEGWAENVAVTVDAEGKVSTVERAPQAPAGAEIAAGPVVPGLANVHSHAFQRAMAGLAEIAGSSNDSFWTWRETMYRLVGLLTPEQVETIAAKLYIELLKGGFTHTVEFHYLHHAWGAGRTGDSAETSRRILAAARRSGIGLTHLPVFYAHSGFGGAAPSEGQRPFIHDVDGFLRLLETLAPACAAQGAGLGLAIHSLRAATGEEMNAILAAERTGGPLHIHVAEQEREVEDCLAATGRRPVEWLLDEMPVDERWCLIHATHMSEGETLRLARSGAVAGLCPATEANLGDGIFPATAYRAAGGRLAVGTDSHVATSVDEELRILEYGQRLRDRRRNRLVEGPGSSVGRTLFSAAHAGGAQAAGLGPRAGIEPGGRADLVVLDGDNPFIAAAAGDAVLDRWIFALGRACVRDVMAGGRWVVQKGRHEQDEDIDRAFAQTLLALR